MTFTVLNAFGVGTDWLIERKSMITASDAPTIVNLNPYSTPYQLHLDKMQLELSDNDIDLFYFAHALEEPIAKRAEQKWPEEFGEGRMSKSPGLIRWDEHPHLGATPDSIVDGNKPFQIKTVSPYMAKHWGEVETEHDVPDGYRIQVMLESVILGSDYGYLAPLFGLNNLAHPIRINVDEDFIDWFIPVSQEWHQRHVVERVAPELEIGDDVAEAFPGIRGAEITASDELVHIHRARKLYMLERKAAEDLDDDWKLQIARHMKDATELLHPETGETLVTFRPKKSPDRFKMAEFREAYPDIYKEFTEPGKPQRSMLFKDTTTTKADADAFKAGKLIGETK